MEIRYLLQVLVSHWRFVLLVSLVAGLGGLAATYVISEEYVASTTILIRPHQEVEFSHSQKTMLNFPPSLSNQPESISQTYAGIMTSVAIATRVVELIGLDTYQPEPDPRWYVRGYQRVRDGLKQVIQQGWDLARYGRVETDDPYWRAVKELKNGLQAKPVEDTYLFSLSATWQEPKLAARIADTAAEVFVEYTRSARNVEGRSNVAFLDRRLIELRAEIQSTRQQLQEFWSIHQAASLDQQLGLALESLSKSETARAEAARQIEEVIAELHTLDELLGRESEALHTATTTASNPVILKLKEDLARDTVLLAGMQETHMPAHPEMKALLARIEEAKRRVAEEAEQIRFRDTSALNPFYQEMRQRALDRRATRKLLSARVTALERTIQRYRAEVDRLSNARGELARLELEVQVLESQYKLLSQEQAEARLAAVQEISEIRALSGAIPPLYPSRPVKIYYLVGGFLAGLLLSLCFVLVADYTDPKIRSAEDISRATDIPVLARVPPARQPAAVTILGREASSQSVVWSLLGDGRSEPTRGSRHVSRD